MKWKQRVAVVLTVGLLLTACEKKTEKWDADTEEKYLTEMAETATNPVETKEKLDAKITQMSKTGVMHGVDAYLYGLNEKAMELNEKVKPYVDELNKLGIVSLSNEWKTGVEDASDGLSALLKEASEHSLVLFRTESLTMFSPDFVGVAEEYKSGMDVSMYEFMLFTGEEQTKHYFNAESNVLDLDIVAERIKKLDRLLEKHKGTQMEESLHISRSFYATLYFGQNSNALLEGDKVSGYAMSHYEKTMKEDLSIQETLKGYVQLLKENGLKYDAPDVLIYLSEAGLVESQTYDEEAIEKETEKK